ncbi:MAG TPA: hypothetical protein PKE49_03600 [Leptospiraceae bacterium]|nr:hypothetical protein [Leptospirales bacterium]HMW60076.1 hypothetical protein [Leptospiraceae bacterium]HMX55579.1 hypothetical protein [Leptospiraceae bacterium]HMY45066.1 hypothetical protein [Leptospiraceae bacterium]HNE22146.1 hypothetical protein [Leptospiraceae bacterium]
MRLIALILALLTFCAKKEKLPDPGDYRAFIQGSAHLLCGKMVECYSGLYFSISPELRRQITVEACEKAALRDLDRKLARHTQSMKNLSVICYQAILDSPCKEVGNAFFWNPSCFALRNESEKAFADVPMPNLFVLEKK